jgi:hypothetical protein
MIDMREQDETLLRRLVLSDDEPGRDRKIQARAVLGELRGSQADRDSGVGIWLPGGRAPCRRVDGLAARCRPLTPRDPETR